MKKINEQYANFLTHLHIISSIEEPLFGGMKMLSREGPMMMILIYRDGTLMQEEYNMDQEGMVFCSVVAAAVCRNQIN